MITPVGSGVRATAAACLAVVCAMFAACATPTSGTAPTPSSTSSESPPTAGTLAATEAPLPPSPSVTTLPPVDVSVVVITLDVVDGIVEASGIIPEVVEDGGECTMTLTRGDQTRTAAGPAQAGQESTFCGLLTFAADQLEPGSWDVLLSYRSASHSGTSDHETVTVP